MSCPPHTHFLQATHVIRSCAIQRLGIVPEAGPSAVVVVNGTAGAFAIHDSIISAIHLALAKKGRIRAVALRRGWRARQRAYAAIGTSFVENAADGGNGRNGANAHRQRRDERDFVPVLVVNRRDASDDRIANAVPERDGNGVVLRNKVRLHAFNHLCVLPQHSGRCHAGTAETAAEANLAVVAASDHAVGNGDCGFCRSFQIG